MLGHWNAHPYFIFAKFPTPMLGHWNAHLYFIIAMFRPLCLVIGMPSSILSSGHPNLMHKHWKVMTVL